MKFVLTEWLNLTRLFNLTQRRWKTRFNTVRGVRATAPKFISLKEQTNTLVFSFKTKTLTNGHFHAGYIILTPRTSNDEKLTKRLANWWAFFKNKTKSNFKRNQAIPRNIISGKELMLLQCKVNCDCEDFKYRMEHALYSQDAADIKNSNGKYPYIRNPDNTPGMCKHILGTLKYLSDAVTVNTYPKK